MGVSGIVAQVILLRELLVSFLGNELTFGIILANWLILEAIGSFLIGQSVERTKKTTEIYVLFQLIFSLSLPFSVFLCRVFKNFIFTVPGEAVGLWPVFYSSFIILLPVAIPHGALFTYGCKIFAQVGKEGSPAIGKVYVLETVGSIIGGVLITFLLIQYFNSLEITLAISFLNGFISIFLLGPGPKAFPLGKGLWGFSIILTLLFAYSLVSPLAKKVHFFSIQAQWKGLEVIHNENSVYGNITVTKRGEQFTFFTDGIPSITAPVPDLASIEDFVHFPMLFHGNPHNVLVLSGGAGGVIHEILKYPVGRVDYVELDPLLLKLVEKYSTPLTQSELSDRRVKVHYTDGRLFVQRTASYYDVILIGLSAPQELQTNRLFSAEFFSIAKKRMNREGILVLTLPGSLTYISAELRDLNGCIMDTLKSVFRHLRIIPGDTNLYLASDSDKLLEITAGELIKRLEGRRLKTNLFTMAYIEYRLQERWLKWFLGFMEKRKVQVNHDFRPRGVFFHLAYWNSLFSPQHTALFKWFEGLSLKMVLFPIAFLTMLLALIFVRRPSASWHALPYAILTSGFAGMMFDLAIIFTFQTLYGFLYHHIGLLITIFMAGVALSSLEVTKRLEKIGTGRRLFLIIEFCMILFSVFLPFAFFIPSHYLDKTAVYVLLYALLLIMSFLSGVLIGAQFPLASKIYLDFRVRDRALGPTAGLLYGADLLGGFFGGLLGGVLLFPILGLRESCFLNAAIKMSSFSLFVLFTKMQR